MKTNIKILKIGKPLLNIIENNKIAFTSKRNINQKKLNIFNLLLLFFMILVLYILKANYNIKNSNYQIYDNLDEETYFRKIINFIKLNFKGKLINNKELFRKSENPKISIVITVFNGQGCLKTALRSVQNQDFLDIEIIFVDDESKDESVKLIKELMLEDPRIRLLQNERNRGALYSKTKGILNAKGKYVMALDVDDLYSINNAFSYLYNEAEKDNLDILGFSSVQGNYDNEFHKKDYYNYFNTSIIYQPELADRAMEKDENNNIKRVRDVIWCYFFKTELFIQIIKEIDEKYLSRTINGNDDIHLFFLLTKRATKFKHLKKIFYVTIHRHNLKNPLIKYFNDKKHEIREKIECNENLSYIELVFSKSDNNFHAKKIVSFAIERYFLNHQCRSNMLIRKEAIELFNLILKNEYIENNIKEKIKSFLQEVNIDNKI